MSQSPYFVWLAVPGFRSGAQIAIDSFEKLEDGWNYGTGIAPSEETCKRASAALERMQILGFRNPKAFPGANGEILLTATTGGEYFSVTVEDNGTYTFNHERDGAEIEYVEGLGLAAFIVHLAKATGGAWHTFGSLIHDGSTMKDSSSMTWLSKSPPTAECQFLNLNARSQLVA